MSCSELRGHSFLRLENFKCGDAGCQYSRLSIFSQLQRLFRSIKTEGRDRKMKGVIRLLKDLFRHTEIFEKFFSHSHILGSLSWEDKCYVFHDVLFVEVYQDIGLSGSGYQGIWASGVS